MLAMGISSRYLMTQNIHALSLAQWYGCSVIDAPSRMAHFFDQHAILPMRIEITLISNGVMVYMRFL